MLPRANERFHPGPLQPRTQGTRLMPAASQIRVMVVDDQMTMRSLIRTGLQQLGFVDIVETPDGEEALRQILARPVHLVISDFNMPKLDGMGLLRALRSHGPTSTTAFVIL